MACCQRRQRTRVCGTALQHFLVTGELRDVHVAKMRLCADYQLEIAGELLKAFQQLEIRVSTTTGVGRLSSGLQAATGSASRWPGKNLRRRRAPGSPCRACSMTSGLCCEKGSRRCGKRRSRSGRSCSDMGCVCDHIVACVDPGL